MHFNSAAASYLSENHLSIAPKLFLDRNALTTLLSQFQALCADISNRVYTTRAKDWENPFRKATFRNEAEQLAVHGRVEDNGDIRAFMQESAALRKRVDSILEVIE